MNRIDLEAALIGICRTPAIFQPDFDWMDSGVFDSLASLDFFALLEDHGIFIQPTQLQPSDYQSAQALISAILRIADGVG